MTGNGKTAFKKTVFPESELTENRIPGNIFSLL
jgi:hypothetical protein